MSERPLDGSLAIFFFVIIIFFVLFRFGRGLRQALQDGELRALAVLSLITITSGTFVYRWLEGWSYLDALYFTVITLTTVGYGDLSPTTSAGKLFTVIYILFGLGIISSFIYILAERSQSHFRTRKSRRENRESETDGS